MKTYRAHRRLTAWLGMLAIWLAVVMPVASQALVHFEQTSDPAAALCTVDALSSHAHSTMADHMDACGYCSVLAHHPAIASAPAVAVMASWVAHTRAVTLSAGVLPSATFPSGRPRDPPAVS
ncbi:MAG TPA: DUF2946 domain-containing protein [Pararobbsia sp.]|nr:DUF2946 domain-containing protein [Pararobbsia sp.]